MPSAAPKAGTAREKFLAALAGFPAGETLTAIAKAAGLSNQKAKEALVQLVAEGLVVAVEVTKASGKGSKTFDGYKLSNTGGHAGSAAT